MGSPDVNHQPHRKDQAIVAFDFDGTLTVSDSFTRFLRWRAGAGGWRLGLVKMAPDLAAYAGHRDRGRLKAASVRQFLRGAPRAQLAADAEAFAGQVWPGFLRYDALACWNDWGKRGAYRVIVTASPETTVAPFARRLGAEALLGTPLVFDADDRVTGAFVSPNCRGEEKVRRLRAVFGEDVRLAAAYGDTTGDTEMLAIADEAGFRRFKG
jgi:phosphatidylglycerophosphatase C